MSKFQLTGLHIFCTQTAVEDESVAHWNIQDNLEEISLQPLSFLPPQDPLWTPERTYF